MYKACLIVVMTLGAYFAQSQQVQKVTYSELESMMSNREHSLTIVNFWATWCGPCIKEMPHFDALDKRADIKVLFVSIDFEQEFPKIGKLIEKKSIGADVLWLNETDYDTYMRKVSDDWSGAIPATLMIDSNDRRFFYEKAFTAEQLETTVTEIIDSI